MVLANDQTTGDEIIADAHILPATHISYSDGVEVFSYVKSTKSPYGYITIPKTELGTKPTPFMAAFSSQGPNTVSSETLKSDITAPGVSVIASWTAVAAPAGLEFDACRVLFNSESGTSMSCPHISSIVGLPKTLHPEWSPAEIRSAILTSEMDSTKLQLADTAADGQGVEPLELVLPHPRAPHHTRTPSVPVYPLNNSNGDNSSEEWPDNKKEKSKGKGNAIFISDRPAAGGRPHKARSVEAPAGPYQATGASILRGPKKGGDS